MYSIDMLRRWGLGQQEASRYLARLEVGPRTHSEVNSFLVMSITPNNEVFLPMR